MFDTVLHGIWFLIPVVFFLLTLWSKLESISGKKRLESTTDFLHQGIFVLGCVVVAYVVDRFFLATIVSWLDFLSIPLNVYRVALLPVVLLLFAKLIGPSREIRIAPPDPDRVNQRNKKRY